VKSDAAHHLSTPKKLLFSLVSMLVLLVLLVVLEGAARLVRVIFDLGPEVAGLNIPDRTLLWRMRPHFDGLVSKGKHDVRTNSIGLRSPELRTGPRESRVRLLVLGDSVTFGYKVANDEAWPRLLESLLNEGRDALAPEVEVVNGGVLGYGTYQEAALLAEYGPTLRPDLVILQFYANDPIENLTYRPLSGLEMLLPRSTLYNLLRAGYLRLRGAKEYELFQTPAEERAAFKESVELAKSMFETRQEEAVFSEKNPELMARAWRRTEEAVGILKRTADDLDTKVAAVTFPAMSQVYGPNSSTIYQDSLSAICMRHEIQVIDLLGEFDGRPDLYDGLHPSKGGLAAAAEIVRREIEPLIEEIASTRAAH
jgi:lysophospholipase L1-like esterase